MIKNKTELTKDEIVKFNPLIKKNSKISLIFGSVILLFGIATLFMEDYDLINTILFIVLAVLQIVMAFVSPILAKRRKDVPEHVVYEYEFTEQEGTVKMTTPYSTTTAPLIYELISKYKFNEVHYIFMNKYIYYVVKDEFDTPEDREFFLRKVNKKNDKK